MTDQNAIGAASTKKAAKRTKWTAEQRQGAVVASLVAGASINEVAERFGVNPSLLSTWRPDAFVYTASSTPQRLALNWPG
jgi:transposase-like protein